MEFMKVSPKSMEFLAKLQENPENTEQLIENFIVTMESCNVVVPEFEESFEWINTSEKLSFGKTLSKKLCVMDFFTYCCINCMHVLPDLHALEENFSCKDGLVVLGVHSAKFQNEKVLGNILSAVLRYDITHPVVNDADAVIWNKMSIQCWPTFVIVSPEGKVLLYLVGEGHRDILFKFVDVALKYYKAKDLISDHSLPIKLAKETLNKNMLHFPGKITLSCDGNQIAISDTGHHRILVVNKSGMKIHCVSNGTPGFTDGSFGAAKFNAPQGVKYDGKCIYVADTENHAIRKIDLDAEIVTTVSGTGKQGNDKEGGKEGVLQEISSPWDVLLGPSPGSDATCEEDKNCLYLANAGTHQIWCYFLKDGTWLKKGSQKKGTCLRFAGSGNEENRNNSYPHKASFAQPSGITLAKVKEQNVIYVADSESSSVRSLDIKTGAVKACVGAERDPVNLFAYGDIDGKGVNAKLQHPLSVAYNHKDGCVYVADSYNHKVKVIDPVALTCTTIAGTGNAGCSNGEFLQAEFNEPGGLAFNHSCNLLYVADTNNHIIRVLEMEKKVVSTLSILGDDEVDSLVVEGKHKEILETTYKPLVRNAQISRTLHPETRNLLSNIAVTIQLNLGDLHYTADVDSKWQITFFDKSTSTMQSHISGVVDQTSNTIVFTLPKISSGVFVKVEMLLYLCSNDDMCFMKSVVLEQILEHDNNGSDEAVAVREDLIS